MFARKCKSNYFTLIYEYYGLQFPLTDILTTLVLPYITSRLHKSVTFQIHNCVYKSSGHAVEKLVDAPSYKP